MVAVPFVHVDVFSSRPYTGNSVAVVLDPPTLTVDQMLAITTELRHFETVFVSTASADADAYARVFDLERELAFAGHPILGAAAVLHDRERPDPRDTETISIALAARRVTVETTGTLQTGVRASLDQGRPDVIATPAVSALPAIAASVGLSAEELHPDLRPEVLSTGLRYLVIAVSSSDALARARINREDFAGVLAEHGAEFAYLLDPARLEGRHWNNDGLIEDVATGSAAGCVAAYLMRHHLLDDGQAVSLSQGRFVARPSRMEITAFGDPGSVDRVVVAGRITRVAIGQLDALPPEAT